jgi:hypothetical protein
MRRVEAFIMRKRDTSKHERALLHQLDRTASTAGARRTGTDSAYVTPGTIAGLITRRVCTIAKIDIFNTGGRADRDPEFIT